MPDVRDIVLDMEEDVAHLAGLSSALRLCAVQNREDDITPSERTGMLHLTNIVQEKAAAVLRYWAALDAATSPSRPAESAEVGDSSDG